MSTERDELAELLYDLEADDWRHHSPNETADAILAAGYRKPRTITTEEELDTLPSESLILDAKNVCREGLTSIEGRNWWRTMGPARVLPSHEVPLPATLLHEGSRA